MLTLEEDTPMLDMIVPMLPIFGGLAALVGLVMAGYNGTRRDPAEPHVPWPAVLWFGVGGATLILVAPLIPGAGDPPSTDEDPAPVAVGHDLCEVGSCEHGAVDRVIDGDTVDVDINGEIRRVRVLGIDTPETKKPGEPVECFGPEATARAEAMLPLGSPVTVVTDDQADTTDKYGRDLRHLTTDEDTNVGQVLLSEGYAAITTFPHSLADQYGATEDAARDHGHGLWGACA